MLSSLHDRGDQLGRVTKHTCASCAVSGALPSRLMPVTTSTFADTSLEAAPDFHVACASSTGTPNQPRRGMLMSVALGEETRKRVSSAEDGRGGADARRREV
jgi:hypothetical protein